MATNKKSFETRAEQEGAEYSTYRAVADIPHGNTIAYRAGMAVPVSNVERYKYDEQGLVERVKGDEVVQAQQAVPPLTPAPAE